MEKIVVRSGVLVICFMLIMGSTAALGFIIPSAQQAKDNAAGPDHSPVIEVIEEDWVLTPAAQNAGEATFSDEEGRVLPLSVHGNEHGVGPDHSLVIELIGEDWVLRPSSNFGKPDDEVLNISAELNGEFTEVFSIPSIPGQVMEPVTGTLQGQNLTAIPEPATMLMLGLGALLLRRKRS